MDIKLDIYNEQCLSLAKSMYLKFDLHALSIEKWYTGLSTIESDRTTWLNYMNSAGLYHDYNTPMTVVSLDTFEEISFDIDTLKDHPTTLDTYKVFDRHYDALASKYPDNELLIKGILYGRDINDIIAMEDFHIVGWNSALVDVQEYDLIESLNDHLTVAGTAAGCPDYINEDNHYPTAIMNYIATNLPIFIKRVRFNNSRQYNANTFYIWSMINRVINMEEYKSYLTYDDVMFLFKHIERLKNGAASKAVFREVLTTILTPKQVDGYYLKSTNVNGSRLVESEHIEADWFLEEILEGDTKLISLPDVVEEHLIRSTYETENPIQDVTKQLFTEYDSNVYPELTLFDTKETEGMLRAMLVDVDYAYLMSGTGLLGGFYEIVLPDSGVPTTLTHSEWMTIYTRILQVRNSHLTDTIPNHSTTQLYKYTNISKLDLLNGGLDVDTADRILSIVGSYPSIRNNPSIAKVYVDNFNNTRRTVSSLIERSYNNTNNLYIGELNSIIFSSYSIRLYQEGTNYPEWLEAIGVDIDNMDNTALDALAVSILSDVVGIDEAGAIALVTKLSSLLSKFVSYKTNIAKYASDLSTLKLGKRPTWNELGKDYGDVHGLINTSSIGIIRELDEVITNLDVGDMPLVPQITRDGSSPFINLTTPTLISLPINVERLVNTVPSILSAEIMEK